MESLRYTSAPPKVSEREREREREGGGKGGGAGASGLYHSSRSSRVFEVVDQAPAVRAQREDGSRSNSGLLCRPGRKVSLANQIATV